MPLRRSDGGSAAAWQRGGMAAQQRGARVAGRDGVLLPPPPLPPMGVASIMCCSPLWVPLHHRTSDTVTVVPLHRLSLMHTCGRWYAAIAAGPPHLLPAAVLACPALDIDSLSGGYWKDQTMKINLAYAFGATHALSMVWQAAQPSCHARFGECAWRAKCRWGAGGAQTV